jgi:hypothetical protein
VWKLGYVFNAITNIGARGVVVDASAIPPVIYATTAEDTANRLVAIPDAGSNSVATTIATAGVNQIFRGVTFAPGTAVNPQVFSTVKNITGFALTWASLLDQNYTVEWTADLASTNWTALTNLTSSLPTTTVIDTGAPATTNRFYRIILNP